MDGTTNTYISSRSQSKLRHALLVTDFYRELAKRAQIIKFAVEPSLGEIRPDAVIGFIIDGNNRLALLEVELSHKGFDAKKYERFDWQSFFPAKPELIIITDYETPKIDYVTHIIRTDLQTIKI